MFVIDTATCRVELVGIGSGLDGAWVMQCGPPLTAVADAFWWSAGSSTISIGGAPKPFARPS
jgi:hypothetical protein